MNTITDPLNPDWQITDKGHVLHRSGLGFRIMPDNLLAKPPASRLKDGKRRSCSQVRRC